MNSSIDHSAMQLRDRPMTEGIRSEAHPSNELEVNVVFTDQQETLAALKTAGTLAHNLCARINLLVPQVVPIRLPLTSPLLSIEFTKRRLLDLVYQGAQGPLDTSVQLLLCRDRRQCLLQALKPHSLVVIAGRKTW